MTNADKTIRNLLDALDRIATVAGKPNGQPYIQGIAEQAIRMAHANMERNSDGYLVAKAVA